MVIKTIAQYFKTQVDTNTLNWELYLASTAFAYNTSFHGTIISTPFKVTNGLNEEHLILTQENCMERTCN
jgi:hypothetical protein